MFSIQKISISILLVICAFLSFSKSLDHYGEQYSEQLMERSLTAFAIARGLNGLISVVQNTEVAMQPAGVGLTLSPGEVLDPVNDLIERFSVVMLITASAAGVQMLLLKLGAWPLFSILLAVFLLGLSAYYLLVKDRSPKLSNKLFKIASLLILIRFAAPAMALTSEMLYQGLLEKDYQESSQQLENITSEIEQTEAVQESNEQGMLEQAKEWFDSSVKQLDVTEKIEAYKQAAEQASRNVINLITLFIVQTLIFPLLFLWLLFKVGKVIIKRNSALS